MEKKAFLELEEMCKKYLNDLKATNKSENTIDSYKNTIKSFISYIKEDYENLLLINTKRSHIIDFFEYKSNNMQKQGEISPNTKKLILTHLKSFFLFIEDESDNNMYDFKKIFEITINTPKRVPKGLSDNEKEKLLLYLNNLNTNSESLIDYRNSLIVKLFFYCGLRKNEMINLKISDLNLENDDVYTLYIIGKGNKEREVFIKKSIIQLEIEELVDNGFIYICETTTKKLMDGSQVYRMLQSIYSKLNIKASVHDLRHTFAKTLVSKNIDITVIKELLGHSSIQTTAIYANPTRTRLKNVVQEVF